MPHVIGIEELHVTRTVVWVLDLPGCAIDAARGESFTAKARERIESYLEWREGYSAADATVELSDEQFTVSDFVHQAFDDRRRTFFEADRPPLTPDDAFELGWLLELSHRELERVVQMAGSELLAREPAGVWLERKQELEELLHLERRNISVLSGDSTVFVNNDSILVALGDARAQTLDLLPALIGQACVEHDDELFSTRKMARLLIHHDLQAVHNLRLVAARG